MKNRKYRWLSLALALLLVLPMAVPAMALDTAAETTESGWDGTSVATSFASGRGTLLSPYCIETAEQLAYMAKLLNSATTAKNYYAKHYRLTADIDLGGKEWTPISNTTYNPASGMYRFKGTFDGDGHTISNFYIGENKAAGTGLFGITQGATFKNFTLQGRVEAVTSYAASNSAPGAAMLAPAMFDTTVENVTLYVDIDIQTYEYPASLFVGSFCGYTGLASTPTNLTNCHAYGSIRVSVAHTGGTSVGGLVSHSKSVKITNCTSDVDIYVENAGNEGAFIGGILGDNYSDKNAAAQHVTTISGCSYTGNIYAYSTGTIAMGGILGVGGRHNAAGSSSFTYGGTLTVESCFFDGSLHAYSENEDSDIYKAAIIGICRATVATIQNCFTTSKEAIYYKDPALEEKYGTEIILNDKGGHVSGLAILSELGAAVRLTTGSSGLRFTSMIDRTLYQTLTAREDLDVQLGTLIAPTTYVEGAGGFTFDKLTAYKQKMGHSAAYLNVPFVLGTHAWLDDHYSNSESENLHYFSGAIVNILKANYNRSFSGVGYMTITTEDGYSFTVYGDYNDAARARTVSYVAMRGVTDLRDTQSSKYPHLTEDGKYSPYTASQRSKMDVFAKEYDESTVINTPIELFDGRKSEYSIVYPLGGEAKDREMAIYLKQMIYTLTGVSLPVYASHIQSDTYAKEIVVGCTERAGTYNFNLNSLENGYRIFTDNERVILLGDTDQSVMLAIRAFIKNFFGTDLSTEIPEKTSGIDVSIPRNVNLTKTNLTPAPIGIDLSAFRIVYSASNETQKRMAYSLRDSIALATGGVIEYSTTTTNNKTYADRTLKGGTQLTVSSVVSGSRIYYKTNSTLKNGDFRITTKTYASIMTVIQIEAGSYYGFEGAENYLVTEMKFGISNLTKNNFVFNGNYADWLKGTEETSKYAYNRDNDARVMFLNVLFNSSATSGNNMVNIPTADRNRLQANMIKQYMPDVLGCQEFNSTKRDGAGSDNLVTLLENLGYVEAIDSRVKNAYPTNQKIPGTDSLATTGSNAGVELDGYGTSGAQKVTVNGETYYTYYNNTPLFYNSETTELIEADYYWYKNQWDKRPGQTHSNGAGDCGSKAATWGLFEDIEYGNQYIVITTHMCTRSDYIRGLQAQEMTALIDELTELYNVPVFLGGDMNGTLASSNIKHFLYEKNYTDAVYGNICEEFTSHLFTAHGYPDMETMDEGVTMLQPGFRENTYFNDNSIDRIFLTNFEEEIAARVFGVISDDYTRSSSDHYPIFIDFDFKNHVRTGATGELWTDRY